MVSAQAKKEDVDVAKWAAIVPRAMWRAVLKDLGLDEVGEYIKVAAACLIQMDWSGLQSIIVI